MLLCVDGFMHATSMCVCHMCICLPVMNHASAHRVHIPGLCHHTWLRYWFTSAPDVPLSCWTSPQAGPHQAATPPHSSPPFPLPPYRISRRDPWTVRGSQGCQNQQAHKNMLRESWENTAASQGDPASGHPQSPIQRLSCFPEKAHVFSVTNSRKNWPGVLLPFSAPKQKGTENCFS